MKAPEEIIDPHEQFLYANLLKLLGVYKKIKADGAEESFIKVLLAVIQELQADKRTAAANAQ